jgi:hypothetical protein
VVGHRDIEVEDLLASEYLSDRITFAARNQFATEVGDDAVENSDSSVDTVLVSLHVRSDDEYWLLTWSYIDPRSCYICGISRC